MEDKRNKQFRIDRMENVELLPFFWHYENGTGCFVMRLADDMEGLGHDGLNVFYRKD